MSYRSNADIDDEDMADISDWTDADSGTGASTQATFDGQSSMKLDSGGTAGVTNYAERYQDIGSFGNRTIFSVNIYCDAIGFVGNNDNVQISFYNGSTQIFIVLGSDGLYVFDGVAFHEVGNDLVVQDIWQEWTFDVNWVAQTMDVYLNDVLKASGVDCSYADATANGYVLFAQLGKTTTNRITYIDWFKAGSDFETATGDTGLYGWFA